MLAINECPMPQCQGGSGHYEHLATLYTIEQSNLSIIMINRDISFNFVNFMITDLLVLVLFGDRD